MKTTTLVRLALLLLALASATVVPAQAPKPDPGAKPKPKPAVPETVRNVGVEEFDRLRAQKDTVVLDVRTEDEFNEGHIPGAVHLDYLSSDFPQQIAKLDKTKTYLVHCASGNRSARACGVLDKAAFPKLFNLEPGFSGWEAAGKPVEKGKK